jgi:hypothetical protein
MNRRGSVLVGVLATVVLALCGCSGPVVPGHVVGAGTAGAASVDGGRVKADTADFAAVRAVLDARARALTTGNRAAFLRTLDTKEPAFVSGQRTYFDNLQRLPVASVSYEMSAYALTPADIGGGDQVLAPDVTEHVSMPRVDQHPVGNEVAYTFVKRGDRWLLGADQSGPTGDADAADDRPWAGGPIAVAQRDGLVVVMDASAAKSVDGLASDVYDDLRSVSTFLHFPLDTEVMVDATTTGSASRVDELGSGDAAAVTYPVMATHDGDTTAVAGWRVKINPDNVATMLQQPGLLRHELTHFVLRNVNVGNPTWLVEGVAEVSGYWPAQFDDQVVDDGYYTTLMKSPRTLPQTPYWSNDPDVNYQVARAAVDYLVLTYGVDKLITLMRAYRSRPASPEVDDSTKPLLKKVYGTTERTVMGGAFRLLAQFHH